MSRAVAEQLIGRIRLRMIPVLADNFIYLLDDGEQAVLIDAGEAAPVLEIVRAESLALLQVLITHDHADHTGGCRTLQEERGVLARRPGVSARDEEWLGSRCKVVSTPGHTKVHKSFYFPELGLVFTGDALINGACGRLLGGTAEELHGSLRWLAALPDETRVLEDTIIYWKIYALLRRQNFRWRQWNGGGCNMGWIRWGRYLRRWQKNGKQIHF